MNHPTRSMIQSEPGYRLIRAVQQDQIYFIDERLVSRPTARMLIGICRMVDILYPQLFAAEADAMGCAAPSGLAVRGGIKKETEP